MIRAEMGLDVVLCTADWVPAAILAVVRGTTSVYDIAVGGDGDESATSLPEVVAQIVAAAGTTRKPPAAAVPRPARAPSVSDHAPVLRAGSRTSRPLGYPSSVVSGPPVAVG